jgi:hypothetical protein
VVQPNFDVIAYLDHMANGQLSFLERNAERVNASEHVAQYRITRDSVYRGLESGTSVQEMLDTWQRWVGQRTATKYHRRNSRVGQPARTDDPLPPRKFGRISRMRLPARRL